MKYLSLFSGIGGIELGIQQAYESYISKTKGTQQRGLQEDSSDVKQSLVAPKQPTCIGYSEFDPSCDKAKCKGYHSAISETKSKCDTCGKIKTQYAIQIYDKHFNHKNYGDITKITESSLPDFNLLVGGFPCQSFSIAGKRGGFKDVRGTLFFEICRIIKEKQPRFLLLENVKGLLSHDQGKTFRVIIATLDELGYDIQWQIINSKNFGVPQNRERVFIIGHLRGTSRPEVFPFGETNKKSIEKIVNKSQCNSIFKDTGISPTISAGTHGYSNGCVQLNNPKHSNNRIFSKDGISPTLNTMQGGNRQPFVAMTEKRTEESKKIRRETKDKDFSPRRGKYLAPRKDEIGNCVTAGQSKEHYLTNGTIIRRLTPKECERLQGFPDDWTKMGVQYILAKPLRVEISDSQRYKTIGNAVTVNVIEAIITKMLYA